MIVQMFVLSHRANGTDHLVVQREHVPPSIARLDLEESDIQAVQDFRVLELRVGRPNRSLQDAGQVVWVEI